METLQALLRDSAASLRRLVAGPATLERTFVLTLGGLVLASILILALAGVGLLRQQATQQALARVELGSIDAREQLRRLSEDTLTAVRLTADRQTLQRLIRVGNRPQLELFLRRSCASVNLTVCVILVGPDVIATTGAVAAVPGTVETRVVGLHYFGPDLAKLLSEQAGVTIRLLRLSNWLDDVEQDFKELHSTALSRAETVARRIDARDVYASSTPLFASTGEGIALIEARLPARKSDDVVAGYVRRLGWITFLLSVAVVAAALLLARRIVQPLEALADAARRLGRGDFSASMPGGGGVPELVALGRTLDDMRRNLVEASATLRRREADAQALLRGIVEGVYAVDAERRVRHINPQAERMLGVTAEAALGRFCGDVLRPCRDENGVRPCEFDCPIVAARERGQAQATETLERADGSLRTVVLTSAGPVEGLQVQVMRDETDLEAARRARDSILANISHEFRTPLAAQLASIELLQENLGALPREQLVELVASLRRGSLRLTRLIDNLLESVRIEAGQLAIRRQELDVADVVRDAVELVESLFSQRSQTLSVDVPEGLRIVGDAPRLVQVLVNLLANANKFAPDRGTVRVGARADGDTVLVHVDDPGPGIAESDGTSIFERFHRATDQEPDPRGLGLGLWIVRSIVERHGGRVHSLRTDDGWTRFVVVLPLAAPEST